MASKYDIVCLMNREKLEQLVKGEITNVDLSADMRLLTDRKTGGGKYYIDEVGRISGSINADGIGICQWLHKELGYTGPVSLLKNILSLTGGTSKKSISINIEAATPEQLTKLRELGLIK